MNRLKKVPFKGRANKKYGPRYLVMELGEASLFSIFYYKVIVVLTL